MRPSLGELGVTYTVHLWLVGKHVVDFLLAIIELFEILVFGRGRVTLSANFRWWGSSTNEFFCQKTIDSLSYHVVLFA